MTLDALNAIPTHPIHRQHVSVVIRHPLASILPPLYLVTYRSGCLRPTGVQSIQKKALKKRRKPV